MAKDFYTSSGTGTAPGLEAGSATGAIVAGTKLIIGANLDTIEPGSWIIDIVNLERRLVKSVSNDGTNLYIGKPFSNDTADSLLLYVSKDAASAVYMEITAAGADITVDGVTVSDGSTVSFGNSNAGGSPNKFVRPRFVDGDAIINLEYFNNEYAD